MIAVILISMLFGMVGGVLLIVGSVGLALLVAKRNPAAIGQLVQRGIMNVMMGQPSPGAKPPQPTPARAPRPATRPATSPSKVSK